jgi:hypothetical protein
MALVLSPDVFLFNEEGKYEWTPERLTTAWDRALRELQKLLTKHRYRLILVVGIPGSGKTTWIERGVKGSEWEGCVFFDATLTSRVTRRPLLEIAEAAGAKVEALVFDVPLVTAIFRNAERPRNRRVPRSTLLRMLAELEKEPPTLAEGFWRITAVDGTR